jgi:glycine cleavage system H protein
MGTLKPTALSLWHHRVRAGRTGRYRLRRTAKSRHSYEAGDDAAVVESVKAAATSTRQWPAKSWPNDDVVDAPESINADAYANWLFKIASRRGAINGLLDAAAYGNNIGA